MKKQNCAIPKSNNKSVFIKPTISIFSFENDYVICTSGDPTCDVTKSDSTFGFDPNETI